MGHVIKLNQTFKSQVSPDRMFNALIVDSHNICPKLMFSSVNNIEFIQGDGDVGTIKRINFTDASPMKYMTHRIDALDKEKFYCKYTLIDALPFMDTLEYVTYEVKFERYGLTGSVCKSSSEYKAKEGIDIKEHDIEQAKDRAVGMYEVVEAYLMAHPHAYT